MKFSVAVLALLLVAPSAAFLLRASPHAAHLALARHGKSGSTPIADEHGGYDASCPGNVFPDANKKYSLQGFNQFEDVISSEGTKTLEKNLEGQPWVISTKWRLSFVAETNDDKDIQLGIEGLNDTFVITIPAARDSSTRGFYSVEDAVMTAATETRWVILSEGTCKHVVLSEVCFHPVLCGDFACPSDSTKLKGNDTVGTTVHECCEPLTCEEAVKCTGDMIPQENATIGHTESECCQLAVCTESMCDKSAGWYPKPGSQIIGHNMTECCEQVPCPLWHCSNLTTMKNKGLGFFGQSDEECCDPRYCTEAACTSDAFELIKDWNSTAGSTEAQCCTEKLCSSFNCSNPDTTARTEAGLVGWTERECCDFIFCNSTDVCDTEDKTYIPKNFTDLVGSTVEQCCDRLSCDSWTCSEPHKMLHLGPDHFGNSDKQCCGPRYCTGNECKASTKWKPKDGFANITGSNQSECCKPQLCSAFECSPSTQYVSKNSSESDPLLGTTFSECCTALVCDAYNCSDGWVRNTSSRLGSTDEECCVELQCKDFECAPSTKWVQRPVRLADGTPRFGSNYSECCMPRMCSMQDYCSPGSQWANLTGNDDIQGSNTQECCTKLYCSIWLSTHLCNASNPGLEAVADPTIVPGSTVGECCVIKSCADYKSDIPTKFHCDPSKKGWGDAECCTPISCSTYVCSNASSILLSTSLGSTDEECCAEAS